MAEIYRQFVDDIVTNAEDVFLFIIIVGLIITTIFMIRREEKKDRSWTY